MRAISYDAGQFLVGTILSIRFKYDWLARNGAGFGGQKEKTCHDPIWSILDPRLLGCIFPTERDFEPREALNNVCFRSY